MHAKYEVSISYGSKVIAKVKVDNRQTDRQTDKQTNRQTNKQTDRQTDKFDLEVGQRSPSRSRHGTTGKVLSQGTLMPSIKALSVIVQKL